MAENSSNVTIQDVPEYMKPYRQALLNAAFGLTFTPEYLQAQGLNTMAGYQPQPPPQQPYVPTGPPPTSDLELNPYPYSDFGPPEGEAGSAGGSILSRGAAGIEAMLRSRNAYASGGVVRAATGSQMSESAKAIEDLLVQGASPVSPDDVTLSPGGTPLGGVYNPINTPAPVMPANISANTQVPLPPAPPPVTPPAFAGPNGVISTPSTGVQVSPGASYPTGSGFGPPNAGGRSGDTAGIQPQFVSERPGNFAGSAQAARAGYNPLQYADESVARDLANRMGAQLEYTNVIGPTGPPSQATLNFGGEARNNAGLVADAYTRFANDPGQLQLRLQGIRDEIRALGGTPGFKKGGIVRMADGGTTNQDAYAMQNPATVNPFLATSEPAPAPSPFTTTAPTATTASGITTPTAPMPSFDTLQPYVPYTDPRTLENGADFGQVSPTGTPQISDLSRSALTGYSNIPSAFDSAGNINAGRTEDGTATTNYGIANDTFNSAGQLALDASRRAGDLSYGGDTLTSSFQDTLNAIRADPSKFSAGDISLAQLIANQMGLPMGISSSQLKSYQMAGPKEVGIGSFLDQGVSDAYMSPYQKAVNDVRRADAERAYKEQNASRQAAAVRAGAFGGSRQAVADSLAERDMLNQKERITAEGQQKAFENAQAQYERDRLARYNADTFNVDRSQAANRTNLEAALGVQALGSTQALDAAKSNQAAGLQAGLANLRAAQETQALARTTGLDAAKSNQSTRLTQNQALLDAAAREDQLRQQAAQGNFGNKLAAMGQQTSSALAANTIGQSRADLQRLAQATELQRLQQMQGAGATIDSRTQSNLDMNYQDFINQRNYPYQQLNWLQGLYSGVPQGFNQEQVLFNRTNPASQWGGLATAGVGALSSASGKKKGGIVQSGGLRRIIDMRKQADGSFKAA